MDLDINKISNYVSRFLDIDNERLSDYFLPAKIEDLDEVVKFRECLFQKCAPWEDSKYIKWRYFSEGAARQNNIWIFKKDDEVLGCIGIEEVSLIVRKDKYSAYKVMDLLVKAELRGIGLGIWMYLIVKEKFQIVFSVGTNKNSYPIAKKAFKEMRSLNNYKLICSVKAQLDKTIKINILSSAVSALIDPIVWIYLTRGTGLTGCYSSKLLYNVPAAVNEFDDICEKIHVLRDKEYLTWRYLDNPRRKYFILGLYSGDELKAISVSVVFYSGANKQKEGFIVDWVVDGAAPDKDIQSHLYWQTVELLKEREAKLIHVNVFDDDSSRVLSKLGFMLRKEEKVPLFSYASEVEIQEDVYNNDLWMLNQGDLDTDLF